MIPYRHNKTGRRYLVLAAAIDATNSRDGTPVTVYCPDDDQHTIFVRETAEFEQKFTLMALTASMEESPRDEMRADFDAEMRADAFGERD